MKQLVSILLLFCSACAFAQGPVYMGDTSQRVIYKGQMGSLYGILNALHDTASIPAAKRAAGLTVIMNTVPYTWTGTTWVCGLVPTHKMGIANGVATLGADGFVPFIQLPFTDPLDFHGFYNPSTDTPNLTDGVGNKGDMYISIDTGTQNLGHGPIDFLPGDIIIADPEVVYNVVTRLGITQVPTDWNATPGAPNSLINKPTTLSGYGVTNGVDTGRKITINGVQQSLQSDRVWIVGNVDTSRTITINGVTYSLGTNHSWSVGTVTSVTAYGYVHGAGTYTNTGSFSPDTTAGKLATKTDLNSYSTWSSVNTQSSTSYTLQASDRGKIVAFTSNSAITLTVPSGLGSAFYCTIQQNGTGQVTLSASGTTLRNRQSYTKTAGQYAQLSILFTNTTDTYNTQGDMQ